jgi:hypothetical protein
MGMRAMCPAVSGEKFSPTENAGYSACGELAARTRHLHAVLRRMDAFIMVKL